MGSGWLGSASSSCLLCLFLSSRCKAGLRPSRPRRQCPCASAALGAPAPDSSPPPKETGRQNQAPPAARPGPAVLRPGNLARGTQREGNFGISQETIVVEEGVGCYVLFLYFPGYGSRVSALGEEGRCLPGGFLLLPQPPPQIQVERDGCGRGGGAGSPTPAWPPFLYLFVSFLPGSPNPPHAVASAP